MFFSILSATVSFIENKNIHFVNDQYMSGYVSSMIENLIETSRLDILVDKDKCFITLKKSVYDVYHLAELVSSILPRHSIYITTKKKDNKDKDDVVTFFIPTKHLFSPLLADTRQISMGAAFRFDDDVFGKYVAQVNFFGNAPIIKVEHNNFSFQFGIEGGMFSLFNMGEPSHGHVADLQNSDYFGGLNFSFIKNSVSFRFRVWHISCHIGDDFIGAFFSLPGEKDKKREWWGSKINSIEATLDPKALAEAKEIEILLGQNKIPVLKDIDSIYSEIDQIETELLLSDHNYTNDSMAKYLNREILYKRYLDIMHTWTFSNKPSYEAMDFSASYNVTPGIRAYFCIGLLLRNNPTIDQGKGYIQYGYEFRSKPKKIRYQIYYNFVTCLDVVHRDMHGWRPDATYIYGIELSAVPIFGNKILIYVEYHNGFSQEGMFKHGRSSYISTGVRAYC